MFDVLLMLLLVGGLVLAGIGTGKAFFQIVVHVQSHPDAGKALFDHLFLPPFGGRRE